MNATILNREFQHPADGWYMIEAKGEHPNAASKLVQIIDDEAASAIVNRFNADAAAGRLRHGTELLVDHEHFSADTDKESRAYGWLQELQNRADGIYGRIRWTATGKAAVDGGDYRFFSTEYDNADLKVLNAGAKVRRVRPLRLDGLTVTNMNNNRGQKPITNRGATHFPGSRESAANQKQNERSTTMKSIAQKLGLAAEASEEAILAEVSKIQNRVTELEPLATENTTLKNRVAKIEADQLDTEITGLLTERKVTDTKVINRVKPVLAKLANREERIAFLDDLNLKGETAKPGARIINRANLGSGDATETAPDEQATAEKIMNRAKQLQAGGMKFEAAWNMARTEATAK